MKFSTRQDTDLPADALFRAVGNFPCIERMLVRRGATVRRQDAMAEPGVGMGWQIGFDWRGRRREFDLAVTGYAPPEVIALEGVSDQFNLSIRMTVVALTRSKSRLIFETDVQPRGMKARLLLQTAKLGKSQLDRKFAERIADFVTRMSAEVPA
ncbi:hypothetical protein SAMN04488021_1569 [Paracoccus aminovorans]|uniref:Polyketide cyclase / dehydrase and lipid transport n=1 Tax=Paracoccus aminovorans TaxID=34004 RepID=A0A1I3EXD6_9RHOB|nr:hypothetical protein [Paracoccus aminovorans]CQR86780.1 hypothetical protein JCM7685_2224 [Paracoccus aminovorans]SFI03633.1 hypothetical protein SAMN04488021_1569 [Paracoccus aminovorans]